VQLIIVEDSGYRRLLPVTATRPAFDALCGACTLGERIRRHFPSAQTSYLLRNGIEAVFFERHPGASAEVPKSGEYLYVNGRVVWTAELTALLRRLRRGKRDFTLKSADDWIAVYRFGGDPLPRKTFVSADGAAMPEPIIDETAAVEIITYPWHLIDANAKCIGIDFEYRSKRVKKKISGKVSSHAVLLHKSGICIGKGTVVGPFTVIDASNGPVIIDDDVTIRSHTVVRGPVWIGSKTVVNDHARIGGGTSIGYNCRAGGEITASVLHGYSNKAHEGFLGHSYIGEWVNIGADTNNSNLKNDYGPIRVMIDRHAVDTGRQFIGMIVGDHSRTGINTMINTGTVIGVGCNVFGAGFPQKNLPDFSWGGHESLHLYRFEKFIQSARAMMARRGVAMSDSETEVLRRIYESRQERTK
jgi:UDP-N-acetylglucosamine diphosphorylase / glucose-1-phosphate thymidylyltransferase / UDP-N-acetylgalactosamine diphosphorylase / glucosamine-1-phosphate N-acetyltransferase / galactosamine-1-phosphate N-acetyltransferase